MPLQSVPCWSPTQGTNTVSAVLFSTTRIPAAVRLSCRFISNVNRFVLKLCFISMGYFGGAESASRDITWHDLPNCGKFHISCLKRLKFCHVVNISKRSFRPFDGRANREVDNWTSFCPYNWQAGFGVSVGETACGLDRGMDCWHPVRLVWQYCRLTF